MIQVDFKNYADWDDKLIFLDKGQYIKFLSESYVVRKIVFDDKLIFQNPNVRVLFKHLVSLGYINYDDCDDCRKYLESTILSASRHIIDVSVNQWYWQNPFSAQQDEYQVIFDVKDIIDTQFRNHLSQKDLVNLLNQNELRSHHLLKNKIGLTIKGLMLQKRLTESQKEIAFSDKSIKTIAYDLGYKDPAYFNRFFKSKTGHSPMAFREEYLDAQKDTFEQALFDLLSEFHTSQRKNAFYANKLYMSEKSLSKKVKARLNISLGQLIRNELIKSAKRFLIEGMAVKEVAFALGFEESNHFSSFFKHHTGITPTSFLSKKYKE